jgi:hypothetical protein
MSDLRWAAVMTRAAQGVMLIQALFSVGGAAVALVALTRADSRGLHAVGGLLMLGMAGALVLVAARLADRPWAWGVAMTLEGILVVDSLLQLGRMTAVAVTGLALGVTAAILLALADASEEEESEPRGSGRRVAA